MGSEWLRIGVGGVVPVHWDVAKADAGEPGVLQGWASVYNVVDQQDDIVLPGAFRKTLQEWRSSGRVIPLVLDHDHSSEGVIGSLTVAQETPYGLKFTAKYSSVKRAQDARMKAKEGHLAGLSIYGPIFKKSFEARDGRELRLLHEVGLTEVSLTPFPANTKALVTSAKGATSVTGVEELDEAWVTDMRAALVISAPAVRKAAVDALVVARYGAVGEKPDEVDDTSAGDTAGDDPSEDAAKYALGIIGESGPDSSPPGGKPSDSLADLLAPLETAGTTSELDRLEAELKQMGQTA